MHEVPAQSLAYSNKSPQMDGDVTAHSLIRKTDLDGLADHKTASRVLVVCSQPYEAAVGLFCPALGSVTDDNSPESQTVVVPSSFHLRTLSWKCWVSNLGPSTTSTLP